MSKNINAGLIIQGDEDSNKLTAYAEHVAQQGGSRYDVYNVIHGAGGDDTLNVNGLDLLAETGVELYGEDGNDTLSGSAGNDTLSGGIGDDVIRHSGGSDQIDGGDGVDELYLSGDLRESTVANVEHLFLTSNIAVGALDLSTFDQVTSLANSRMTYYIFFNEQTALSGVDFTLKHKSSSLGLFGSAFGDSLDVSDSTVKFKIDGRNGDDILTAGSANAELNGSGGNDTLYGGDGNDKLSGGGDNDFLNGGGGNDKLYPFSGDATVYGGEGNDQFFGNGVKAGDTQLLDGGSGNDRFESWKAADCENVAFSGGEGVDQIMISGDISNIQFNSIEAITFDFSLTGGANQLDSFDRITGYTSEFAVKLKFTSGGDFTWKSHNHVDHGELYGSREVETIDMSAAKQDWTIDAGGGNDTVRGGKGYMSLYGGGGDDVLYAGKAGSELVGGTGDDTLIGGTAGDDFDCRFGGVDTIVIGPNSGKDNLYSFDTTGKSRDIIDLSRVNTIHDFNDLMKHHVTDNGDSVTFDFGGGNKMYAYVAFAQLDEASFIF